MIKYNAYKTGRIQEKGRKNEKRHRCLSLPSPLIVPYVGVQPRLKPDLKPVFQYPVGKDRKIKVRLYRGEQHLCCAVMDVFLYKSFCVLVVGPVFYDKFYFVLLGYIIKVLHQK